MRIDPTVAAQVAAQGRCAHLRPPAAGLGGIPVEYKGGTVPPPDQRRAYN
jgi:hypothetical protein